MRGALGRLKGLTLGLLLLVGIFALLAAVLVGRRAAESEFVVLFLIGVVAGAFAFQVGFCLLIYRVLPSASQDWRSLWSGALLAATVLIAATAAFAGLLTVAGGLAKRYPPTLSTALVIGLWLYAGNIGLLLGAELNEARRDAS